MLDTLDYTLVEGQKKDHEVTIFALSTCGFCKRAMAFLDANGLAYRYIYVDRIPLETKAEVKRILKEQYSDDVAFPFATIDGKDHIVGFIEADWKRSLGL